MSFFVVCLFSCAGKIDGEVDGRTIPMFGSAVYGIAARTDPTPSAFIHGLALPGDSCSAGHQFTSLLLDKRDSGSSTADFLEQRVKFINDNFPINTWSAELLISGDGRENFEKMSVDFSDLDSAAQPRLSFCYQETTATIDDPQLGAECYQPIAGTADVRLSGDRLSMASSSEVDMINTSNGKDAGVVTFEFSFSECSGMSEDLAKLTGD
jgi:hypothetical protein